MKTAEEERLAKDVETQGDTEGQEADKKPGSSVSKTDKPKSGK